MVDKGIHSFIQHKLDHGVDNESIRHTLIRAGFSEESIDEVFEHIKRNDPEREQKAAEENGFLPPLQKSEHKPSADVAFSNSKKARSAPLFATAPATSNEREHKGLFKGRLLRRDFILGFLFFFGLGYITLAAAGFLISTFYPEATATLLAAAEADDQGLFLLIIPLLLLPISIMLFSLIVRRLHNLGMPGGLALVFFGLLIYPVGPLNFYGLWVLHAAIIALFIVLLAKKGDPAPNKHGTRPSPRGSFFRRIFNV